MSDQRIQATEYMVGANHPTMADTLNRLTLVGHNTDGSHKAFFELHNYGSLAVAVAAMTTGGTLFVDTATTVTANLTVPANIEIVPTQGGIITVATGIALTYNGSTARWPIAQVLSLSGTGSVTFLGADAIYPDYFMTNTVPGTTDMTLAIQTALNSTTNVKLRGAYNVTGTLYFYDGSHLIGENRRPGWTDSTINNPTLINFNPTTAQTLFNTYAHPINSYMYRVYIGGIDCYGNGTNSAYGIFALTGRSVYENLLFKNFNVGIHTEQTMLDRYTNISIMNCLTNCIETGDGANTSNIFDNIYCGYSPWGAVLRNALGYSFIGCRWESLTTGGINFYQGFGTAEFLGNWSEDTPGTSAGSSYAMFYVGFAGPDTSNATNVKVIGGHYKGTDTGGPYGSFVSTQHLGTVSGTASKVVVMGADLEGFSTAFTVDSTYTASNSVHLAGINLAQIGTFLVGDSTPTASGFRVYGSIDNSSGSVSSCSFQGNSANVGSVTFTDPVYGAATQKMINVSLSTSSQHEYDFVAGKPNALVLVTATDGVSTQESGLFSIAYITGTSNCTVKQVSGTSNMSATNASSKLCVYPGASGAGAVFILNNMTPTLQVTAVMIN